MPVIDDLNLGFSNNADEVAVDGEVELDVFNEIEANIESSESLNDSAESGKQEEEYLERDVEDPSEGLILFGEIESNIRRDISSANETIPSENIASDELPPPPKMSSESDESDQGEAESHEIDNLVGETINGCLVEEKVGQGGMGTVYRATQKLRPYSCD